jgi:hypothetical protein
MRSFARTLEMRARDNIASGMTHEEARSDAQKRFGNTTPSKEQTREIDIIGWMDNTARDLRYAGAVAVRGYSSQQSAATT